MRQVAMAICAIFAVLAFYFLDRSMLWLGHPIWSPVVIVAGVVIAVALAMFLPAHAPWQGALALIFAGVAGYLSSAGKADFVASYVDDALAGRYWFFGYQAMLFLAGFGLARLGRGLLK